MYFLKSFLTIQQFSYKFNLKEYNYVVYWKHWILGELFGENLTYFLVNIAHSRTIWKIS